MKVSIEKKFLANFVGDWDVEKNFYGRDGAVSKATGTCHQSLVKDGRFLKSEFVFERDGVKSAGEGLIGFDRGKFTSVWTDSRSTRMSFRQSKPDFDGVEIVLEGKLLEQDENESKVSRKSKTVTRLEDSANKIVHRQYSVAADGKERLVMELLMTRKRK